ncbi:Protein of unknown function [Lactobacillus equicursoris DSM 19284 = JCM 14600 = CIP 110162]|nr:hypothetical protein [Lactobacillus equicursoris]CCK85203.1 Protein of unknown function [Lactobacillus equicursoris DSM 19284 = JCM 14600 = CIP 110162]
MINTVGIYMAVAVDIVWKNRRALTKSQGLFYVLLNFCKGF